MRDSKRTDQYLKKNLKREREIGTKGIGSRESSMRQSIAPLIPTGKQISLFSTTARCVVVAADRYIDSCTQSISIFNKDIITSPTWRVTQQREGGRERQTDRQAGARAHTRRTHTKTRNATHNWENTRLSKKKEKKNPYPPLGLKIFVYFSLQSSRALPWPAVPHKLLLGRRPSQPQRSEQRGITTHTHTHTPW